MPMLLKTNLCGTEFISTGFGYWIFSNNEKQCIFAKINTCEI